MPTWRRIKVSLVERTGSESAALDMASQLIAELIAGASMGMLRAGKRGAAPERRVEAID